MHYLWRRPIQFRKHGAAERFDGGLNLVHELGKLGAAIITALDAIAVVVFVVCVVGFVDIGFVDETLAGG